GITKRIEIWIFRAPHSSNDLPFCSTSSVISCDGPESGITKRIEIWIFGAPHSSNDLPFCSTPSVISMSQI
ncbi:hypothetical protein AVEN_76858-1, partial [Araneus ventricosus]